MRAPRSTHRRTSRRILAAVVAASLLVPATLLAAAPAEAAAQDIGTVDTLADGRLDVAFTVPNVLWVKVTVLADRDTGAASLFSTDQTSTDSPTDWTWHTDDPVQLPAGTAPGDYPVDVDYRVDGGTVTHWSGVQHGAAGGQLDYRPHLTITGARIDEVTDFDHRSATATGTITAYDPATGQTGAPPAGTQVDLAYTLGRSNVVTTSAAVDAADDGTFELTLTPGDAIYNVRVRVLAPTGYAAGTDYYLAAVETHPSAVRVSATPDRVRLHKGASVTITGTAQRLTAKGWQAVGGVRIASTPSDSSRVLGAGTSDTQGRFSYRITPAVTTQVVTSPAQTPYVTPNNTVPTTVSIPTAATVRSAAYRLDDLANVTTTGRVYGACGGEALTLQYSANGRSGWSTVATVHLSRYPASCGYKITGYGHPHGYYRVTHAESDALLAFTTPAKYLARTITRITGVRLTPKHPSAKGKLTATGRLTQVRGRSWVSLRHGLAELIYKPRGDTQYYLMAKGYTSSTGAFTLKSTAYGDGYWAVIYRADSTHLFSDTKDTYVDVR